MTKLNMAEVVKTASEAQVVDTVNLCQQTRHLSVIGRSGGGKSTLIGYLSKQIEQKQNEDGKIYYDMPENSTGPTVGHKGSETLYSTLYQWSDNQEKYAILDNAGLWDTRSLEDRLIALFSASLAAQSPSLEGYLVVIPAEDINDDRGLHLRHLFDAMTRAIENKNFDKGFFKLTITKAENSPDIQKKLQDQFDTFRQENKFLNVIELFPPTNIMVANYEDEELRERVLSCFAQEANNSDRSHLAFIDTETRAIYESEFKDATIECITGVADINQELSILERNATPLQNSQAEMERIESKDDNLHKKITGKEQAISEYEKDINELKNKVDSLELELQTVTANMNATQELGGDLQASHLSGRFPFAGAYRIPASLSREGSNKIKLTCPTENGRFTESQYGKNSFHTNLWVTTKKAEDVQASIYMAQGATPSMGANQSREKALQATQLNLQTQLQSTKHDIHCKAKTLEGLAYERKILKTQRSENEEKFYAHAKELSQATQNQLAQPDFSKLEEQVSQLQAKLEMFSYFDQVISFEEEQKQHLIDGLKNLNGLSQRLSNLTSKLSEILEYTQDYLPSSDEDDVSSQTEQAPNSPTTNTPPVAVLLQNSTLFAEPTSPQGAPDEGELIGDNSEYGSDPETEEEAEEETTSSCSN